MDFYLILGLERSASLGEIKRAYRRLARRHHPDINPGDHAAEALFRQIAEAYETLLDPDRRRQYDTGGGVPTLSMPSLEFQGFDFSAPMGASLEGTFSELFAEAFGQPDSARGRTRPEAGADLHTTMAIAFGEAMHGGEWAVNVTRLETCLACRGLGQVRVSDARCAACHGTGSVRWVRGHMVFTKACAACGSTGRLQSRTCSACGGQGLGPRAERLSVAVPAGVYDGTRLRLGGRGNAGRFGGEPGDLYVDVFVSAHPRFRRDGDDIHVTLPIAIHEAALGTRLQVAGIDGPVRVRVSPGTQSGQRFRLRGRGAASPRDGARGDLVLEVQLVLPPVLDERSRELLREFGRLNPGDVRAMSEVEEAS